MQCDRCNAPIAPGEEMTQGSQTLCEDCLMDNMSPAKACDPWAVKMAQSAGSSTAGPGELKGLEKALFDLVTTRGAVAKEEVPGLLGVKPREVERAFSVLRHMELLRGRRRDDGGADLVPFAQP